MSPQKKAALINRYFCAVQELLKMNIQKPWKLWLDSPSSWLSFVVANLTEEETKKIVEWVKKKRVQKECPDSIIYVASLIEDLAEDPKYFVTLREMVEKYGPVEASIEE